MLNKDKLIKIHRILSAQNGTLIPITLKPLISYDLWKGIKGNTAKSYTDYLAELGIMSNNLVVLEESSEDSNNQDTLEQGPKQEDPEKSVTNLLPVLKLHLEADPLEALLKAASKTSSLDDLKLQTNLDLKKEADKKAPIPEKTITSAVTQGLLSVQLSIKATQNNSTASKVVGVLTTAAPIVTKLISKPLKTTPVKSAAVTPNQTLEVIKSDATPDTSALIDVEKLNTKIALDHKKDQVTEVLNKDLNPVETEFTKSGGTQLSQTKTPGTLSAADKFKQVESVGGQVGSAAGAAIDLASSIFVNKADYAADSWTNSESRGWYDTASSGLMMFGGLGAVAGAAMKGIGLINDLGGSKAKDFSRDEATINLVGSSYGGTVTDINNAASKAGKKYGLFESGKRELANEEIDEASRLQNRMQVVASTAKDLSDAATYSHDNNVLNYLYQVNGGFDLRYLRAAKTGGTIEYFKDPFKVSLTGLNEFLVELSDVPTILKSGGTILDKITSFKVELSDVPELEKFKDGGNIKDRDIEVIETDTTLKSVIPEGALHKNKHHLDVVGVDDSELTKKGIPVVDTQGELQAEIELNEIIFTLEVTKELESRYREFYDEATSNSKKDELALEAGKLLWKEILYNTDDRTGLIDTLKQGGSLKPKKVSKPAYNEWVKDVNKDFLNSNYDLEAAYKYLPFELLERWKFAVNSPDPDKYMNYQDLKTGEYTYHLNSVAPLSNGDYIFLKKGTEKTNPELHWETDTYYNGTNGLNKTHYLIYDGKEDRYYYRKKHKDGGVLNLNSGELELLVKQTLINILVNNGN